MWAPIYSAANCWCHIESGSGLAGWWGGTKDCESNSNHCPTLYIGWFSDPVNRYTKIWLTFLWLAIDLEFDNTYYFNSWLLRCRGIAQDLADNLNNVVCENIFGVIDILSNSPGNCCSYPVPPDGLALLVTRPFVLTMAIKLSCHIRNRSELEWSRSRLVSNFMFILSNRIEFILTSWQQCCKDVYKTIRIWKHQFQPRNFAGSNDNASQTARFMGPTWGASGADRTQVGPMLAPWTLLSGVFFGIVSTSWAHFTIS